MKNPMSKAPVAAFSLPPHPPKPVADAIGRFDAVADQWAATKGEIDDAELAAKQATAETLRAAVAAAKDGKDTSADIETVEREHAAIIAALHAKLTTLASAVDEVGTELAIATATHRAAWLDRLDKVADDAEARYLAALKDARAALAELAPARGAVAWLTSFDHSQARVGAQQQFAGGRLYVDTTAVRRESDTNPVALLDVLSSLAVERPSLTSRVAPVTSRAA